jgi:hypothetical protein
VLIHRAPYSVLDGVGTIFLNFFLVIVELAKCTVALFFNSLLTLHALKIIIQYLKSSIAFTYINLGRNINLKITYDFG